MNWMKFWNERAIETNEYNQVARIINGEFLDSEMISRIALRVAKQLELTADDLVLDLCCGNGMLTNQLSKYCRQIDAVDISRIMIQNAKKKYESGKIQFNVADVIKFVSSKKYDKILLYFSFQYFDSFELGERVVKNILKMSHSSTIVLLGDIPDRSRLHYYFKRPFDRLKYFIKSKFFISDMGKFWSREELDKICMNNHLHGSYFLQEDWQPYSVYRFDYIIRRKKESLI